MAGRRRFTGRTQRRHVDDSIQHGTHTIKRGPRVDRDALHGRVIVHRFGLFVLRGHALIRVVVNDISTFLITARHDPVVPIERLWMPQVYFQKSFGR